MHSNTWLSFSTVNTVLPTDHATGPQGKGQRRKMKVFYYFCGSCTPISGFQCLAKIHNLPSSCSTAVHCEPCPSSP